MKRNLLAWWEEKPSRGYVAKRSLVTSGQEERFFPFTQFTIYYCGEDFTPRSVPQAPASITYLINGEKESPDAPEDNPQMHQAKSLVELVGGAIRQEVPQIIPVLYVSMRFADEHKSLEISSDQVPLSEDENRTVRVLCGQFENVAHSISAPKGVTILDVVLRQGGTFSWRVPAGQNAFIYVVGGEVQIGQEKSLARCHADTLVWAYGRQIEVMAECLGGRFLVATLPVSQTDALQEKYVQEVLPDLDRAEN